MKMASIDTRIEIPMRVRELETDPMIVVAFAASGVSAVATPPASPLPPRPPTGPPAPLTTPIPCTGDAAGAVAAEEATKKRMRRRATAKVVTEVGCDAMVNGEEENEMFWEVLGFLFVSFFFSEEKEGGKVLFIMIAQ